MGTSDLIALVALFISLVGLWLQSSGSRQQLLVANISEYTKRYQEIFAKMPPSLLDPNFDLESFSDVEKEAIIRNVWSYFDLCYEQYYIYHDLKLVNRKVWKNWQDGMRSAMGRTSFQQCWKTINVISRYPNKFVQFINEMSPY